MRLYTLIIVGLLVVGAAAVGALVYLKTDKPDRHQQARTSIAVSAHDGASSGRGGNGDTNGGTAAMDGLNTQMAGGRLTSRPGAANGGGRSDGSDGAGSGGLFGSQADPDGFYEPGELLVLDPPGGFTDDAQRLGYSVLERSRLSNLRLDLFRLRIPGNLNVPSARDDLAVRFPGLSVDANHYYEPQATAGASRVRAEMGWRAAPATCGKGVRLGMIDGGVDVNHVSLRGQDLTYRSFHRHDRRPGPADHGTAIAAMLVGSDGGKGWGGLLPGATLKAANMFEYNERDKVVGSASALMKAVDWLAGEGVHAVNLSVAGADNKVLREAFGRARDAGLVLIAAAGNWGRSDRPAYPAAYDDVLAVTAISAKDRKIYRYANQGAYIEFAAPGVHIWTAVPGGGRYQSGTSMAAPYVSAMVASNVARGERHTPDAMRAVLRQAIRDLGQPGKDPVFGWGLVDKEPLCGR